MLYTVLHVDCRCTMCNALHRIAREPCVMLYKVIGKKLNGKEIGKNYLIGKVFFQIWNSWSGRAMYTKNSPKT